MPNPKVRTLTIGGVTYDLQDNISGYITGITSSDVTTALGFTPYNGATNPNGYTNNTGTITSVKTTAGAHTTIDVSSGAANFNVPTKTSHLTNDSGFLTGASTLDASKLSGTIPGTITGTTQSSTDNSTKLATTAFVQSVISGIDTEEVHMVTITATYDSETDTTTFSLNNTYQEISGWINDGDVVVLQDSVGLYSYYFTSDGSGEYYFTSVTGDYFIISSSNIEYISDYYVFQSDLADYITSSELANYAQFTDIADYISSELANYAQLTDINNAVFNHTDSIISSIIVPWIAGEDFGYIQYRNLINDKTADITYGVFGSGDNLYSSITLGADEIKLITSELKLTSDNNHYINVSTPNLTNDITLTLPNTTGTIALTSDIPTIPAATGSNTTGISVADHSTTTIYGVGSSTTSVTGVSGSTSVYGVKSGTNSTTTASKASGANGTAPTWTFEEKSVPNITAVGSGSLTFTMDSTDTKKLIISHTHTAPTLGTAIKIQSKSSGSNGSASTWSFTDVTVPIRADSATTVPTAASSATTVPIKNDTATTVVTSKTHSVTDTGHTHTI